MADKFVGRQKKPDKKEDKSVVMTLRIDRELQDRKSVGRERVLLLV